MTRRLILHVGDCKTGSTILQSMLARGDCTPEGLRLFSPGQGMHGPLARSLGDRPALYPARWDGIAKRLSEADWDVAVLSSELFEFINPRKVARAVARHLAPLNAELRVIAYIRPHAARVLSQFAENLKLAHDTDDFAAFMVRFVAAGRLDFSARLTAWREAFGDAFIVRPFERAFLNQSDVRHDFLNLILDGAPYTLTNSGQDDNASLALPDLALMRHLQRRFDGLPLDNRVTFGKQMAQLLRAAPASTEKLRLPEPLYTRLRAHCEQDAAALDTEWVKAPCFVPALAAAAETTVPTPQSLDARDHLGADAIRIAEAFADLLIRQMDDDPKAFGKRLRA